MIINIDTADGFSAKKLENFAYQACDKIYNKEDNGPYDNLRWNFTQQEILLNIKGKLF